MMAQIIIVPVLDPRTLWLTVQLDIRGQPGPRMVLDIAAPFSSISESVRDSLVERGLLGAVRGRHYLLRDLTIQRQSVPDLRVGLSPRVTQLGVDGLLGLNFFGLFTEIHCHVPSLRITLSRP
jgi:hypothetical protein